MQNRGTRVLGYLSVGTIEKWRSWYGQVKRYRLTAWQDWKDEWFADTSKAGLRRKLTSIAEDEILAKGFDGLFLDNVDMVEVKKHRKQRAGMGELVADLDELVGGAGDLFAQNGAPGVLDGLSGPGRRPPDRPPRRLEPRGRHLDLRLRPPALREEPDRRPRGRARRAR